MKYRKVNFEIDKMNVSIITAVLNGVDTIEDCIINVTNQTYANLEHIIIDGGSTDGTVDVINKYRKKISHFVSEPDNGIYCALNKGIELATGDIIGFLHADDLYGGDGVIETVVFNMKTKGVDSCYGDLLYVNKINIEKTVRYWKSSPYEDGLFHKGWMPPHPTFFAKKEIYNKYGCFNTDLKIAADYELMLRLLGKGKITTHYIPKVLIKMRTGGASNRSLKNILLKTAEDYMVLKENEPNNKYYSLFMKNISKLPQFFKR